MALDTNACERARQARDPRFDGRFYIGVVTTGVYCRPICPVRMPKAENVRFYPSAAAAAAAGFRPCLRCRPESSPGAPVARGTGATVARALRLIDEGALDRDGVDALAARLGVGARHLGRLFVRHLGASPIQVAQTRRLHLAVKLLDETDLAVTEIAYAAGFGSVRRFNEVVRATYRRPPGSLRRRRNREAATGLRLELAYRPPLDWSHLLAFLELRAVPGLEEVAGGRYRRTIALGGRHGWIEVGHVEETNKLELVVHFPDVSALAGIVARVRAAFDLDADPLTIERDLAADPLLAGRLAAAPGLRVPGAWDGFELAVRAVLGQAISVVAARTLTARLVARFGPEVGERGCARIFPSAETLAARRPRRARHPGPARGGDSRPGLRGRRRQARLREPARARRAGRRPRVAARARPLDGPVHRDARGPPARRFSVWRSRPAPRRRRLSRRAGGDAVRAEAGRPRRPLAPLARLRGHAPLVGLRRAARLSQGRRAYIPYST